MDIHYKKLIDLYEERYSSVLQNDCAVKTPITVAYPCTFSNSDRGVFTNHIILDERNKFIAETILGAADTKIVLVYGKVHLEGIRAELTWLNDSKKPLLRNQ